MKTFPDHRGRPHQSPSHPGLASQDSDAGRGAPHEAGRRFMLLIRVDNSLATHILYMRIFNLKSQICKSSVIQEFHKFHEAKLEP